MPYFHNLQEQGLFNRLVQVQGFLTLLPYNQICFLSLFQVLAEGAGVDESDKDGCLGFK